MKRILIILFVLLGLCLPMQAVHAEKDIGEGFAPVNFKELIQTIVMMGGGFDIHETRVADEYARLVYCDLYKKSYHNDVEWNKIRKKIVSRALEKREYFRILYEMTGAFQLERYDFEGQFFPLTKNTAMRNVGSLVLISPDNYTPHCPTGEDHENLFVPHIRLLLNQPLTLDKFRIPPDEVEEFLARQTEAGNRSRWLFGRIRIRITEAGDIVRDKEKDRILRENLIGEIVSVNFYLDSEFTKPVGGIQVSK